MSWEKDEGLQLRDTFQDAADYFSIGSIEDTKRVGGNANKNYFITTDKGKYVFKKIIEHPIEDLQSEIAYLERLRDHNLPAAFYLSPQGLSPIYKRGDQTIVVLPRLEGVPPKPTPEQLQSIGSFIAKLNLIPKDGLPERNHWLRKSYLTEGILLIERHLPERTAPFKAVLDDLRGFKYDDLPHGIVHGDMSPENCLYKDNEAVGFLDWEEVGKAPAVLDLATCILNFCFEDDKFNSENFNNLSSGYNKIRPLSGTEIESLPDAIRYAGLTLSVWRLIQFGISHPDSEKVKGGEYYWRYGLDKLVLPE